MSLRPGRFLRVFTLAFLPAEGYSTAGSVIYRKQLIKSYCENTKTRHATEPTRYGDCHINIIGWG